MTHVAVTRSTAAATAVDHYFEAWNARDITARAAAIQRACAADIAYTDPKADVKGHQGLSDMIEAVQTQLSTQHATFTFLRTSAVDEHHGRLRFNWALKGKGDAVLLAGVDFGQIGDDGRLQVIVGFFGDIPTAA